MKSQWFAAALLVVLASSTTGDLSACGAKFLVPSRGLRFELTPTARSKAALLLYVNQTSALPGMFAKLSVDPALRKAGYQPTIVGSRDDFDRTLAKSAWDIVLIDFTDGPSLSSLRSAAGSPSVLAVATKDNSREADRAKKQYAAILKSPGRSQAFVEAIDGALAARHKAKASN